MDAEDWDARYAAHQLVWSASPNRWVAAEVGDLAPGAALDLAAGEGRNALWLAERGWAVTAVDFSAVALDKAAAAADHRGVDLRIVRADVETWTPPAAAFDLVLIAYLQLPARRFDAVLRHASAAVAPGGSLLVVAHDRDNLTAGHGGPQDPEVLPSVEEVVAALDGLTVVRAEQVRRPVALDDGGEATAIDLLVRAVRAVRAEGDAGTASAPVSR